MAVSNIITNDTFKKDLTFFLWITNTVFTNLIDLFFKNQQLCMIQKISLFQKYNHKYLCDLD